MHKDLSLEDLRRRFGVANVSVAQIDGAEGETSRGIVLFADDPMRRAEIFPQDDANLRGISAIRVSGTQSRWQLDNGVHLGMTLAEMVRMNGAPISFNGLDWDYGGVITDWHAGTAASQPRGTAIRSVALNHAEDAAGYPVGEGTFLSSDVRYPIQGTALFVGEIGVSFVAEAE
ncbi:MAG: hypothetical protein ABW187_11375 [Dokdonella sp.]